MPTLMEGLVFFMVLITSRVGVKSLCNGTIGGRISLLGKVLLPTFSAVSVALAQQKASHQAPVGSRWPLIRHRVLRLPSHSGCS